MSALLEINRIDTGYDSVKVVDQVSLALQPGEIGCILGPSGCGKTTVLRAIAGFEAIWSGSIRIDNVEVSSASFCQVPEKTQYRHGVSGFCAVSAPARRG